MKTIRVGMVLALALGTWVAAAQTATPAAKAEAKPAAKAEKGGAPAMAMPKPAPELAKLKYFVGRWNCEGKGFASPMGPEHPSKGKARVSMEMGGFWASARYEEAKTAENQHPFSLAAYWGWDAHEKKYDATTHDVLGGRSFQESPGWEGDKFVWSGETTMGDQKMKCRDTFTKKSDTEFMHTGEMEMNGQWAKLDEETCTKEAAATAKKEAPAKKE